MSRSFGPGAMVAVFCVGAGRQDRPVEDPGERRLGDPADVLAGEVGEDRDDHDDGQPDQAQAARPQLEPPIEERLAEGREAPGEDDEVEGQERLKGPGHDRRGQELRAGRRERDEARDEEDDRERDEEDEGELGAGGWPPGPRPGTSADSTAARIRRRSVGPVSGRILTAWRRSRPPDSAVSTRRGGAPTCG